MWKYGLCMIGGILRQGIFSKDEIIVSNLTEEGRARSEKTLGVVTTLDNNEIVRSAKTVVLAVKPQFYEEVLTEVHDSLTTEHTIIGIAPGKTLAWLEEKAGLPLKVVRFMPNTPAQVGAGMTAVCTNDRVSEDELAEILKITDSFGCTEVSTGASDGRRRRCRRLFTCLCVYVYRSHGRCRCQPGNAS